MAFETYEESIESGRPVELYTFTYQNIIYRYTTDDHDITILGATYFAEPGLARSVIEDTGNVNQSQLSLDARDVFAISRLFEVYPPSSVVTLVIERTQRADPTDRKVFWVGRVLNVSWSVGASRLTCQSLFTRLKQPGLRRIYSKNCPHLLYGPDCKADPIPVTADASITAVSSNGFEVTAVAIGLQPDGFYAGGFITFEDDDGIIHRRGITKHEGDTITLTYGIIGLGTGDDIAVTAGCDRTKATCNAKFDNVLNYGGFPYIPQKNPFGNNSVF